METYIKLLVGAAPVTVFVLMYFYAWFKLPNERLTLFNKSKNPIYIGLAATSVSAITAFSGVL